MGKSWDATGVAYKVEVWKECLRVLKPGGHLLAFGGSRTYHRLACAVEDAGFEIRDQIMWVYGSGFPKSLNVGKATDSAHKWIGWGTALKPAHEPIVVARKPLEGTVAENVLKHGTGAINVDGCRVEGLAGSGVWGSSNAFCQEGRVFNASPDGTEYRSAQHPAGRWPANFIHDGSGEVLAGFPQTKSGALTEGHKQGAGCYGRVGGEKITGNYGGDSGSAARFFYCAKASRGERDAGCEGLDEKTSPRLCDTGYESEMRMDGKPCSKLRNHHPTVKPIALMRYLVRLVTPPGGLVLDPFTGSGTTGVAALREGMAFVGCEQSEDYIKIATARLRAG
jgi:site-specific DNA-methyltransferase (adenine-specific)